MAEENAPVGVFGAGRFGRALVRVIAATGQSVILGGPDPDVMESMAVLRRSSPEDDLLDEPVLPENVRVVCSPLELTREASIVILALRSSRLATDMIGLMESLEPRHALVHTLASLVVRHISQDPVSPLPPPAALEDPPRRVSEWLREQTPVRRFGVLAGPIRTEDLGGSGPNALVVASPFTDVRARLRGMLPGPPSVRVYESSDLASIELTCALSGVMAIALGLHDGRGFDPSSRALLVTRAVAEMGRICRAAGRDPTVAQGLAGLGNLLVRTSLIRPVTGTDAGFGEYALGLALAREEGLSAAGAGARDPLAFEVVHSALCVARLVASLDVLAPLVQVVDAVLSGRDSVRDSLSRLLQIVPREE